MKHIVSILLILQTFGISKEVPAVCKKSVISLEEFKKECTKENSIIKEYIDYIKKSSKDLSNINKEANMYGPTLYNLSHNYKDIKEFVTNREELQKYIRYVECNAKGDEFKVVYEKNRAFETCSNDMSAGYTISILEKKEDKIKIYHIDFLTACFVPEPIYPPQKDKKGSKNEKHK